LPIKTAPLEKFQETIIEIFEDPPKTKPLSRISWNFCEEQLEKALKAIS